MCTKGWQGALVGTSVEVGDLGVLYLPLERKAALPHSPGESPS